MEGYKFFNGFILPDGRRVEFPVSVSLQVEVQPIKQINHPAYHRSVSHMLVAREAIEEYAWIGYYAGYVKPGDETWNPYQIAPDASSDYCVDGLKVGNELRFINDARGTGKEPNVGFFQTDDPVVDGYFASVVVALRDIQKGEELLAVYGDEYWEQLEEWYQEKNPYACDKCSFRTSKNRHLWHHMYTVHTLPSVSCNICKKLLKHKRALKAHMKSVHNGSGKIFKCGECDVTLKSASAIIAHRRRVHTHEYFMCKNCDYKTTDYGSFNNHQRVMFKCRFCEFQNHNRAYYYQHLQDVHHVTLPVCEYCNKTYASMDTLRAHLRCCKKKNPDLVKIETRPLPIKDNLPASSICSESEEDSSSSSYSLYSENSE